MEPDPHFYLFAHAITGGEADHAADSEKEGARIDPDVDGHVSPPPSCGRELSYPNRRAGKDVRAKNHRCVHIHDEPVARLADQWIGQ